MSNRVEGERVICYSCQNEWDRAHGGLECPRCQSEFVEILAPGTRPDFDDPPEVTPDSPIDYDTSGPMRSLNEHNPWAAPDPEEDDIRTVHFNTGGGNPTTRGFSFTRTYTFGGGARSGHAQQPNIHAQNQHDAATTEVMRNFETMFAGILGPSRVRTGGAHFGGQINVGGRTTTFGTGSYETGFGGPTGMPASNLMSMLFQGPGSRSGQGQGQGGPLDMFSLLMNPMNAHSGDSVWSQEAFDRIMSQLMEQNQSNGAPPATEDRIDALPRKTIDRSMLGNDDKAECSICMDSVEIGTEVTVLPCKHWFHFECIKSWLSEHDTCPHCRKPITPEGDRQQQQGQGGSSRSSNRRRSSRRSSSVASPLTQMRNDSSTDTNREGSRQNPISLGDHPPPSELRNAREQYYSSSSMSRGRGEDSRPSSERQGSRRSTNSANGRDEGGGGGGGIGGWIRNRMNYY